jgi:hypothetical protein
MGEIAYMEQKRRAAVSYIFSHPGHEATLIGGRFIALWTGGSLSPWHDFLATRSAWFRYVLVFNIATALAALLGIIVLFRDTVTFGARFAIPVSSYAIIFPCAYYMTLALPRYLSPIDPVIMLLTAVALTAAWARFTSSKLSLQNARPTKGSQQSPAGRRAR